jgi:hypothetical protein
MNDLMREVKKSSNTFIKENELSQAPFSRQDGFGAFSYSLSHFNSGYKYVLNQKEHQQKQTF